MVTSPASLRNKLKLRQLALLAELDASGSLHKASDRLGMSQPAATRLLHELEDLIGTSLFERTSRGMAPTDMGRLLIRHASMVLAGIDHVYREAKALQSGNAGTLRTGLFPGAPPILLARAIAQLKAETPHMDVQVVDGSNETLLVMLRDGALDMVVARAPEAGEAANFEFEMLFTEGFSVVCAADDSLPPASARNLAPLVHFPWILPFSGSTLRTNLDVQFQSDCGRLPDNLIESISITANVALVVASQCLAVMPRRVARHYAARGLLRVLMDRIPNVAGHVGIITRSGEALSIQAARLVDALRVASRPFNTALDTES
jgi:DNA-binding transcriptional LysR family regulator